MQVRIEDIKAEETHLRMGHQTVTMPIEWTLGMVRSTVRRRWRRMEAVCCTAFVDTIAGRCWRHIAVGRLLLLGPTTSRRHDRQTNWTFFVVAATKIVALLHWLLLLLLLLP